MTELELRLVALGRELDFPPAPDVAGRLDLAPRRARWPLAVALVAALAVAAALAIPSARTSILRFFHIRGVSVELVDRLPPVRGHGDLALGRPVGLARAGRIAGFQVLVPEREPDSVWVAGCRVSLVYGSPDAPRLLLTEVRASVDPIFFKKLASSGETRVEYTRVRGGDGLWIGGATHFLMLLNARGEPIQETMRLAANTLVWESGERTLRIEGRLTKAQALVFARSVR